MDNMKEICVKVSSCKKLIIKDNYDWEGGDPSEFISHTKITIKYKDTLYTVYDEDGYLREKEVLGSEHTKWWIEFEDGRKLDLVEMIEEFTNDVINECSDRAGIC